MAILTSTGSHHPKAHNEHAEYGYAIANYRRSYNQPHGPQSHAESNIFFRRRGHESFYEHDLTHRNMTSSQIARYLAHG